MAEEKETPEQPDLAGYQDVSGLAQGYRASSDEAKRQKARADLLEQQLAERQVIPQRNAEGARDPAGRLTEWGVPVDALDEFVSGAIQKAFAPLAQGFQARNEMLTRHPDYNKFESDVAQFISSDPDLSGRYQRMFASDPTGAMEYAYLKFGQTRKTEKAPTNGASKKEASVPSQRASNQGPTTPSQNDEVKAKAWERYQKTGDPTAFAKARLREVISDEFLSR